MTENNPIPSSDPVPPATSVPPASIPPVTPVPVSYATPADPAAPYVGPAPTQDDKTMAMLAHILTIVGGFLAPLIIWLIKKDTSPFVNDQGRESLNFQLTCLIGYVIGIVTACLFIGTFIILGVWLASLILSILATVEVNKGVAYRYPFTLRLIK